MRRLYFFDKQFNYKDVIVINNFNPIADIISTQSFKIETPLMPVVDNGDICILKDNSAVVFIGNVLNVEESEKKTKTITISYIDELFNINGEVADLSGNIITWITNTLTTNFISVGDNLQKISLSIVNNCSTAYSGTYTFDSTNIKDCLRNIFNYSGVYVDFDIDFADNGSIDSLICNIRSNIEEETIKLKYNMPIISEIKRTVTNSQNVNKLVLLPDDTVTGGSRYEFYLLKDGTISTDAENVNRFENVKQEIQYYASDYTAESLLNSAKEVLGGEQFNHSIGFFIKHNSSFNIGLYKKVIFYDKESVVYNSIITKIQYGTEFDYVELGVVRLKLTDKLQKESSKKTSSSTSGGGSTYVLPQATSTTLGGIIASEKTTETNEVKIDPVTGKLYAPNVAGNINMDDIIDGETYVKTENNLSDTLKSNYDSAYADKHTHSNKTILDNTTASYTTAEQTKLGAISGTNTGDETDSTIKTKLGITTLSGSNTGDQDLSGLVPKTTTVNGHALNENVTVSKSDVGLGSVDNTSDANKPVSTAQATALDLKVDKTTSGSLRRVYGVNVSNSQELTEIETTPTTSSTKLVTSGGIKTALDNKVDKATTLNGYGITDAYTKTETDTKYAHSLVLSGTSLSLYNNLGTPTALSTLTISDSSSASAISTNARLVTERDIYYGLPNINGVHTYTSSTSIYAPTSQLSTSTSKRYIIGASSTTSMATENTNASCYMENGVLYSNNLATLNTGNISTVYNSTNTQTYSTKYIEDNFAQMLYTTPYYANKATTTTANLTSTIPTLSASNYLTSTTTNTAFNWTTPNFVFTNTLTGNLSLQASSLIYLSLPFSISVASQTVNFGYRVKVNGVAISSNQTFGAVAYTGDSGHTIVNRVYLQCTTDSLTEKTNYVAGDIVTIEVFTQQATSTSMTTRAYCGATIGGVDYYTFNELAQFRSQLGTATPTVAGTVYGHTSNIDTNTFYGLNAGSNNITGYDNLFIGRESGYRNTTGYQNTAIGEYVFRSNISGYFNTAIGGTAMYDNTTGYQNTAVGCFSLGSNTTGNYNTGIGKSSLLNNKTGNHNVVIGNDSLWTGTNVNYNVAIGSLTLEKTTSDSNVAIGYKALNLNTSGGGLAIGALALENNTTGFGIAIGASALNSNTTGIKNIAVGLNALNDNTTGSSNIAIGDYSGTFTGTGSQNFYPNSSIFIGDTCKALNNNNTNQIVIGYNTTGHGSNTATWGNTSITDHYFTGNVKAGGTNLAKVDASNLTSGDVDIWQEKCNFERVDTLYDYLSSASSKNWGYTNGIQGGVTISGKDFSKYKSLRIHFIKNYGSSNGVGNIYHVILSKYGIDSSSTYIGGCLIPNGSSKTSDAFWSISKVDATKTSFNHYGAGYGTVTENASGRIFRIEGIY